MKAFRERILTVIISALYASIVFVPANFIIGRIIIGLRSFLIEIRWLDRNSIQPIILAFSMTILYPTEIFLIGVLFYKTSFGRRLIRRLKDESHSQTGDEKEETDRKK